MYKKIAVIGGGAWGTALATASARKGLETILYAREESVSAEINSKHTNSLYLAGALLDTRLTATSRLEDCADADAILLVTPAQHLRSTVSALAPMIKPNTPLVICSKGIEAATGKLMSQVLQECAPGALPMVLSGPTFAIEVARGLPCAVTLACGADAAAQQAGAALVDALGQNTFRLYLSDDIVGAEVGGAVKNVLAIATGMVAGLGLGENTRAAVITRGLVEMTRFGAHFGAKPETLMGLSGIGDLILTCSSPQSRNMSLGMALGQGQSFEDIMAQRNTVAEGAHTVAVVHKIATQHSIDMPITDAVYQILCEGASVDAMMEGLLSRPFTKE